MPLVHVIDKKKNIDFRLDTSVDDTISLEYLRSLFPGAIGLKFFDSNYQSYIGVPLNNKSFSCRWNEDIIYEPIYITNENRQDDDSTLLSQFWSHWKKTFLAIIFIWIGSIIPSLWANIYESLLDMSKPMSNETTTSTNPLGKRIALLSIWSILYMFIAVFVTQALLDNIWKSWKQKWNQIKMKEPRYSELIEDE